MYELGLAKDYSDFLANSYNPPEIFMKSCASDRCIESASKVHRKCIESALISALYPSNDDRFGVMMQHAMALQNTGNRLLFKQFD